MTRMSLLAATTLASLSLALSPAQAGSANRAWVSGHGSDAAGCGAPTSPCRTFQYVHDNVIAAGGEIDVLDPAGYGPVTISKALSIVNDGVGAAGVQAVSGDAIVINAGASDVVTLRGLDIDGLGTGSNGVVFNSGAGLTIVNCVIRHFFNSNAGVKRSQALVQPVEPSGDGVLIQPTSGSMSFLISNVIASDNGLAGVVFRPPSGTPSATGTIDRLTAVNNYLGVSIDTSHGGALNIAVSNSVLNNNSFGIEIDAATALAASIDNSSMSGNTYDGLDAGGAATVLLGRSVIASNARIGVGATNESVGGQATIYTYGDNRINQNGTDIYGPLTAAQPR